MKNSELIALLDGLPLGLSYKRFLSNKPVDLNKQISLALGENKRRLIRVLATVVDAISNKLEVKQLAVIDTALQAQINQWLQHAQWNLREKELYRYAVRDGRSYALVSYRNGTPYIDVLEVYDGRCGAYVWYDNNKVPVYAINTWYQGETRYVDIYYPDRIEKYILEDGNDEWQQRKDSKEEAWPIDYTDNNNSPLGIPLIEYTIGESDLADGAVQIQDDINKVIIDQLAIDRTMGYPLRYMKGSVNPAIIQNGLGQSLINPITGRSFTRSLELPPGSIYSLEQDTELGQLDSAKPDRTVFDMLLHLLTLVTKVPSFYFTGSEFPSGIALLQAESRLNHLAEDHMSMLSPSIIQTIQMMIRLNNTYAGTNYDINASIDVQFHSPQVLTYDLQMQLDNNLSARIGNEVAQGIRSLYTAVKELHPDWDNAEIEAEIARIKTDSIIQ